MMHGVLHGKSIPRPLLITVERSQHTCLRQYRLSGLFLEMVARDALDASFPGRPSRPS